MTARDFSVLLNPKSVAIIGASRSPEKIGNIVLKNIIEYGFKGKIFPVNPEADNVLGLTCYKNYDSIPEIPDLAIISIPAKFVASSLKEIALKGTKNVVIFTAGFREVGAEGVDLQIELDKITKEYKLNIIGPNCLGFVANSSTLNATFGPVRKLDGNLRFLSQSGAIATAIFDWAASHEIGFSEFITLGNKANINEVDFLNYWLKNPLEKSTNPELSHFTPIGVYTESIDDGMAFVNTVSQLSLENPVFVLKPGRSNAAKKAMQSHTGSLAGESKVLEAALRDAGAIQCEGIEDFFDMSKVFSWENTPKGNNIVIVSNAGGPAVITTDFVEEAGLQLAEISTLTKDRLSRYLPAAAGLHNPIDVLGDALAQRYADALDAVLGQKDIHAAIVILTPQVMTEAYLTAQLISRLSKVHKKPILCSFMGGNHILEGEKILNMHKIPNFKFPERAVKALGKMWQWENSSSKRKAEIHNFDRSKPTGLNEINETSIAEIIQIARNSSTALTSTGQIVMNSFEVEEILRNANINVPVSSPVTSIEECLDFCAKNGWPVVLKIISDQILHKSDIGGVKVGLNNRHKLQVAFNQLKNLISSMDPKIAKSCAIQIQKQSEKGIELILGVKRDPNFGHVMMFGAGGVLAEVLEDVNLKLLPVDINNAYELVTKSKVRKLLEGFRGDKKYDLGKLYFLMEKLSELVIAFPEFEEIEINPVILTENDVWAVDGKAIIIQ